MIMIVVGIVCGFIGFGIGMIFVLIGFLFFEVIDVVLLLVIMGFVSMVVLLLKVVWDGDIKEVFKLGIVVIIIVFFGIWLIMFFMFDVICWLVCFIVGGLVVVLFLGWCYCGLIIMLCFFGIGGVGGIFGGFIGLIGFVVILFYLVNGFCVVVVCVNMILFLVILDIVLVVNLFFKDLICVEIVGFVLVLSVLYFLILLIG